MKIKTFDEPIPFKGSQEYLQVGTYGGIPIYISKRTPRGWAAQLGALGNHVSVSINDEVYEILKESKEPRKYLETICEHELRYGPGPHEHEPRTEEELEVLGFLRKYGIESELDRAAPSL